METAAFWPFLTAPPLSAAPIFNGSSCIIGSDRNEKKKPMPGEMSLRASVK
jgi:hypothetical protein